MMIIVKLNENLLFIYDYDKNLANVLEINEIPTIRQVKFSITFDSNINKVIYLGQKYDLAFISNAGIFYFLNYNYYQNRMHMISKLRHGVINYGIFTNIYSRRFKHKDCFIYFKERDNSIVFFNYKKI